MSEYRFLLGLDLGQASDPTALALLERTVRTVQVERPVRHRRPGDARTELVAEHKPAIYHTRHLDRAPIGTPYPKIVRDVAAFLERPELAGQTQLVIDYTGVGRPVYDMFRAAGLDPVPITIHGGDAVTSEGSSLRVPKRDLVGCVQVLLQSERLKFAAELHHTDTVIREMQDFRVKISEAGHDSYNAREGAHDDLLLALAIACWQGERATFTVDTDPSHYTVARIYA